MKRALLFLSILVLILIVFPRKANAEYIDLSQGGMIIGKAPCRYDDGKVYLCVVVEHKSDKYVVLIDEKGEKIISKVVDGKLQLLWARGAI